MSDPPVRKRPPVSDMEFSHVYVSAAGLDKAGRPWLAVEWAVRGYGFGVLSIAVSKSGTPVKIETEGMGREFAARVLAELVTRAKITE